MQNCSTRTIFPSLVILASVLLAGSASLLAQQIESPDEVHAGQGIMAGEVSDVSALVQVRLTKTQHLADGDLAGVKGTVEFQLTAIAEPRPAVKKSVAATSDDDFIARASFSDLVPNTRYRCETQIGTSQQKLHRGPTVEFKTLPGEQEAVPVSFAVVTGMDYDRFNGYRSKGDDDVKDKDQGYPALETIRKLKPDFFVGTGDNVYYDRIKESPAKEIRELRQKWHQQFAQPRFKEMLATVPTFWMVDDHDYRKDDCDNTGDYLPAPETAKKVLLEQLPYPATDAADAKTYRTYRVSKDLQVWFTENRFYRSPNKMPDGPDKTIWGDQQKQWLQETLTQSDATFKILISPTPMIGPDDLRKKDNHCNIGGFRHERDEFFKFIKANGLDQQNFFLVCGDRHWQYHALDPSGIEEFSCGALVDANSRLGKNPGHPQSTDPDGKIKQPYTQKESSGGFLIVRCEPAKDGLNPSLKFEFFDENGVPLYDCAK